MSTEQHQQNNDCLENFERMPENRVVKLGFILSLLSEVRDLRGQHTSSENNQLRQSKTECK
jgi:hypothetical protein